MSARRAGRGAVRRQGIDGGGGRGSGGQWGEVPVSVCCFLELKSMLARLLFVISVHRPALDEMAGRVGKITRLCDGVSDRFSRPGWPSEITTPVSAAWLFSHPLVRDFANSTDQPETS